MEPVNNIHLSPEEAQAALNEAGKQKERAKNIYNVFNGTIFIIWGSIYIIANTIEYFQPKADIIWLPLVLIGFILSFWFGSRVGSFLRSSTGRVYRGIWIGFGLVYFLLGWGFTTANAPDQLFSFVVNLFVAYALVANAIAAQQPALARAGALLAVVNTIFFTMAPSWYYLAMAVVGLLAVVTGSGMIKSEI